MTSGKTTELSVLLCAMLLWTSCSNLEINKKEAGPGDKSVRSLYSAPSSPERISVDSNGMQASAWSTALSVNQDGRFISFTSSADNLVTNDTNSAEDIFLRDRLLGTTVRVSVSTSGGEANDRSFHSSISDDGRFIAFDSNASNLVDNDTNAGRDVFVRDLQENRTFRVSVATDGGNANGPSQQPTVSADGNYVAFYSQASNLVGNDTNQSPDVFVHELSSGETTMVSVDSHGEPQGGHNCSAPPSISGDGRYVAFCSSSPTLVPNDTNSKEDIFVHDRANGRTRRVSVDSNGTQGDAQSVYPVISANGNAVVFVSLATNLTADATTGLWHVYAHDLETAHTRLLAPQGSSFEGFGPDISADGRHVVLGAGTDTAVIHDRTMGTTEFLLNPGTHSPEFFARISGDGRHVAFLSQSDQLVNNDTNGVSDVFATAPPNRAPAISLTGDNPAIVTLGSSYIEPGAMAQDGEDGDISDQITISGQIDTGTVGTYQLTYTVTDTAGLSATPVRREIIVVEPLSHVYPDPVVEGPTIYASTNPAINADGRYVVFFSTDYTLVPGGSPQGGSDLYVLDRLTTQYSRISVSSDGIAGDAVNRVTPSISADGRFVAFASVSHDLVPNIGNGVSQIYVRDRLLGRTELISAASSGEQANSGCEGISMSSDGRYVAFLSHANNLDGGDAGVFVRDRLLGTTSRIGETFFGSAANGLNVGNNGTSISADGRYVAFSSKTSDYTVHTYVRDRNTSLTSIASISTDGQTGNGASYYPRLSADGNLVAFTSEASNLVANDINSAADIFVHNRITGETHLASVASSGLQSNGASGYAPAISGDGRFIAFSSQATNLVPGDINAVADVFVHDRVAGITSRLSVAADGSEANGLSRWAVLSADGRYVAFDTTASNLTPNATPERWQVMVSENTGLFTLNVEKTGSGNGVVTIEPSNVSCGDSCVVYPGGMPVSITLRAQPNVGSVFAGWQGGGCSGTGNCTLAISESTTVQAVFERKTYAVSGRITDGTGSGIPGAAIYIKDGFLVDLQQPGDLGAITDEQGYYTISGLLPKWYSLVPEKSGYGFNPPGVPVLMNPDISNVDFSGYVAHSITGRITTCDGQPKEGVHLMTTDAVAFATTNANGYFTMKNLPPGTYTIRAQSSAFQLVPRERTVVVDNDISNVNFLGDDAVYRITGRVAYRSVNTLPGDPITDATLTTNCGQQVNTSGNGDYTMWVLPGTHTISVSKQGFTFVPSQKTLSGTDAAGVAVHNFEGHDRPPVVMVHGWNTTPGETFMLHGNNVPSALAQAHYHVEFARMETDLLYTPSVSHNAVYVAEAIDRALAATGQPRAILIAHSMGGIVSRAYIEGPEYQNDVSEFFTFGSPHLGTPMAVYNALGLGGPAVLEMNPFGITLFNLMHQRRSDVIYHVIGGAAPETITRKNCLWSLCWHETWPTFMLDPKARNLIWGFVTGGLIFGDDDGFIPTDSAVGLSGRMDRLVTDEVHATAFGEYTYFNRSSEFSKSFETCIKRVLVNQSSQSCGTASYHAASATPRTFVSAASAQIAPESYPVPTQIHKGMVEANSHLVHSVPIERGPVAFVVNRNGEGELTVTLSDPNGMIFRSEDMLKHPENVYFENTPDGVLYIIKNPSAGVWEIRIHGENTIGADKIQYTAYATFESTVSLQASLNKTIFRRDEDASITATITGETGWVNGTVTIRYGDDTTDTTDMNALGGTTYGADIPLMNIPGTAVADVIARGVDIDGVSFERTTQLHFQISPPGISFGDEYSDVAIPLINEPGRNDGVEVSVGVVSDRNESAVLSADLADTNGNLVAHSIINASLTAGENQLTIRFDGDDIYRSHEDGPFMLTNLILVSETQSETLVLDQRYDAWSTNPYSYESFGPQDGNPVVQVAPVYTVEEGSQTTLTAFASSSDGEQVTLDWDLDNDGTYESHGNDVVFAATDLDGPGHATHPIAVKATSQSGQTTVARTGMDIVNVSPMLQPFIDHEITLGDGLFVEIPFEDPGPDTWTAEIDFGDGSAIYESQLFNRMITLQHQYETLGAYNVVVIVKDDDGGQDVGNFVVTVRSDAVVPLNLALGKPAWQSSNQFGKDGTEAVDGNTDGNWNNGSVSCTDGTPQPYWEVDLGAVALVEEVVLYNRTDCCSDRLSDFDVLISRDQTTWEGIHFPGTASAETRIPMNRNTGRYVRVQLRGTNFLSLAEVKVMGFPNLSMGKAVHQSSNQFAKTGQEAVDGNTDGNWGNGSVSCTDHTANPFWQVDLGAVYGLARIDIYNRTDCCAERLSDFDVLVSEDDTHWIESHFTGRAASLETIPITPVNGRYVKVQLNTINFLSLAEVEIFGGTPLY